MDEGKVTVGKSTVMVRSQFKTKDAEGPVEEADDVIAVHKFLAPPAKVGCGMGLTINMGNFESRRVDAWVTLPCTEDSADDTYDKCHAFVSKKVEEKASQYIAERDA